VTEQEFRFVRSNGEPLKLAGIEIDTHVVKMPLNTFLALVRHANELQEIVEKIQDALVPPGAEPPKPEAQPVLPGLFPTMYGYVGMDGG
jgi:hypothetical protein